MNVSPSMEILKSPQTSLGISPVSYTHLYGNIRRSDVTGSIASVSSESISKVASASVADALAGKMAGVQITTADGALDAEISVRVRGGGSITQDNSPLFLVDGFPVDDLSGIPPVSYTHLDVYKRQEYD